MPPAAGSRALRIGVDGREMMGRATGVGRYIRDVLRAWVADPAFAHTLVIFTPSTPSPDLVAMLGPRVTWHEVPSERAGTVWEQWPLPRAVRRVGVDVFFAGAYTAPLLLRCPFVVAIHDVSYYAHPEWFRPREGLRRRWLTRESAKRAHTVITLSDFSAGEIVRHVGVARDRIVLAPPGAPERRDVARREVDNTVLFVGSLFTRRLIPELIEGFAGAARHVDSARLVLVGDNRTAPLVDPRAIATELGVADRVEWLEYVPDAELDRLYASARVFAFLSTYEGFAMTPLEALSCGVAPVLLDTPVAREIYGDAALFTTAEPASIEAALRTLLEDAPLRARLVAAGSRLRDRYVWAHTASTIRTALERAATSA